VKFPVWYSLKKGEVGKILLPKLNQLPVDPQLDLPHGYMRDEVLAETDIMDTWATSSITPQLSSKGISAEIYFDKARHEKLFPADMRPQAHEIIRSWAFYTIAKAMLHEDKIPWKNLMISGWCLAADKSKMSKSKGNGVTPTALIEEKSADIVRYWASASNLGADIAYSEEVFKIGQKLVTKLFNSAKFASMQFDKVINFNESELKELVNQTADVWILTRLEQVVLEYEKQFKIFEYARAREVLEDFFWKDYCDNYLEICKVRSYGLEAEKFAGIELNEQQKQVIINQQLSAISALKLSLNAILKLFAPFVPFICEELYSAIYFDEYRNTKSVHARNNCAKTKYNFENEVFEYSSKLGKLMLEIIFEVRKFKSEKSLSMKSEIDSIIINKEKLIEFNLNDFTTLVSDKNLINNLSNQFLIDFNSNDIKQNLLNSFLNDLKNVCNTKSIVFSDNIILSKNSLLTQIS
jgi:valyl-tRNA synthetase